MISRPPTCSVSRVGRDRKTWKEHACTNRYTRSLDSVSNTLMTFLAIARPAINTTQAASTPHTLPQTTKHCYGNIAFLQQCFPVCKRGNICEGQKKKFLKKFRNIFCCSNAKNVSPNADLDLGDESNISTLADTVCVQALLNNITWKTERSLE